jgi:small subunit ribosomal protein S2
MKEKIAVREAMRLGIPVFAMVDTNSDPKPIDFPIPANDDASKSIQLIVNIMCQAIKEGLGERSVEKENTAKPVEDDDDDNAEERKSSRKTRARKETSRVSADVAITEDEKDED